MGDASRRDRGTCERKSPAYAGPIWRRVHRLSAASGERTLAQSKNLSLDSGSWAVINENVGTGAPLWDTNPIVQNDKVTVTSGQGDTHA